LSAGALSTDRVLRSYLADLHIHTALSPCASDEMTPPAIVAAATKAGLDVIAISDHNAAGNVAAVQQAARDAGNGLTVLPGMEITSAEEAHVLGVFPDLESAEGAAAELRTLLPLAGCDYYARFGDQSLLASTGHPAGTEAAALAAASPMDLTSTVEFIHRLGGLAIAAHVDRKAFSVYSQLGFFPKEAGFDGVEVSRRVLSDSPCLEEYSGLGLPLVGCSDSHYLDEIGTAATELRLAAPEFSELALAFAGAEGRSVTRA
jgi:PHP family Zn ribbon phosphoesterase